MTKEELEILKGEIADRLVKALKYSNVQTPADLARILDSSHPLANNYFKKERVPTLEYMSILSQSLQNINIRWVLTGEGKMIVDPSNESGKLDGFDDMDILSYINDNRERFKNNVTTKKVFDTMFLDEWMAEIKKIKDELIEKYGK